MQRQRKHKYTGYTLIEALVAFAMFSIILGGALSLIAIAVQSQRRSIGIQDVVGEVSFVGELMTRAVRQGQKNVYSQHGPPDECLSQDKLNYEITHSGEGIKFIDREDDCREFYLDGEVLRDNNLTTALNRIITADNVRILAFKFEETGATQADNIQPSIIFVLEAESKRASSVSRVQVQSTITQRTLDIKK